MILCQKKHCPKCLGVSVVRKGFYPNGKQRWFCLLCNRYFCWKNIEVKQTRERVWFKQWIVEGDSVRQLSIQSGHSRAKLNRIIDHWLNNPPQDPINNLKERRYLIFDGTFLRKQQSIVTLMDAQSHKVVYGQYGIHESSADELITFFEFLIKRGLNPISCTVDGNPHVIKVIKKLWPNIIIQRCLVHIQRQGLSWCRRDPKTAYGKKLREIFLLVPNIRTNNERDQFLALVRQWEEKYGQYIKCEPNRGWVFSDIKRARSMLIRAIPDMFHYLDNPGIEHSTNGLEGYYSRLKAHYRQHRGLSKNKLPNYFKWYFFFKIK